MDKKINFPPLVADLVQQLVDLGANQNDIIYTLTYYGMNDKQIKEWYGLPYEG